MTEDPYSRNEIWYGSSRVLSSSDLPDGVVINFHARSSGNSVHLAEGARYHNVVVDLGSAIDCVITIGKIRVQFGGVRISFVSNAGRCSTGTFVKIGDDCVFNGAMHIIGPLTAEVGVSIGRDCLFASGISVRGSSHHGLWDLETGSLLNPEVGIDIGDHVWIGDQAVVLNKARIPNGSVVAARSIVNKPFTEAHSLLAGAPAAARRSGVDWTHEFPLDNGAAPRVAPQR
ncbi:hypothetical protein ACI7YT_03840 [Microbacterium sp. M]|uniref:hypothetical protein n=1 Tax=Microbacterium sp. M TaxID=3377125 RepID=UPI00386BEA06